MGIRAKRDNRTGQKLIDVAMKTAALCEAFAASFDEAIAKNEHRREPYFLFYHADWYGDHTQMRATFTPMGVCPPKMLNTMCWRIDNTRGSIEQLWALPKDAPIGPVDMEGEPVQSILKDSAGLPVTYGN